MTESMEDYLGIFIQGWRYYAPVEEEILLGEKVKGRDAHALVVETFHVDFEGICTEIDEKFHISDDWPVNQSLCLIPQKPLESLRPLTETQCSIIVIRSFFKDIPEP